MDNVEIIEEQTSESILTSIKKLLEITEEYDAFDTDIIIHINSAFMILNQLGVGPSEGFRIKDKSDTWNAFTSDVLKIESVKTYIYLKVKLVFDPPSNSIVLEAYNSQISELEWRLNVAVDSSVE